MNRRFCVHILEGTKATGYSRVYRCGKTASARGNLPYVGCADLAAHPELIEKVTCSGCVRVTRYRAATGVHS